MSILAEQQLYLLLYSNFDNFFFPFDNFSLFCLLFFITTARFMTAVPAGTGTLALLQQPACPDHMGDDAAPGDRAAPQWSGCLVGGSAGGDL